MNLGGRFQEFLLTWLETLSVRNYAVDYIDLKIVVKLNIEDEREAFDISIKPNIYLRALSKTHLTQPTTPNL
jgi:hypothetical protein